MASTLYRREPGTTKPYGGQVRAVWAWLQLLRRDGRDAHYVGGAIAAAEWCIGLSNAMPVRGRIYRDPYYLEEAAMSPPDMYDRGRLHPATQNLLAEEINAAAEEAQTAPEANRRAYADGAYGFLMWWVGIEDLPALFVPDAHGRIPAQRAGAA